MILESKYKFAAQRIVIHEGSLQRSGQAHHSNTQHVAAANGVRGLVAAVVGSRGVLFGLVTCQTKSHAYGLNLHEGRGSAGGPLQFQKTLHL